MDARTAAGVPSLASADVQRQGDGLIARLGGTWRLGRETPAFEPLLAKALGKADSPGAAGPAGACTLTFDAGGLGPWDTSLLVFLRDAQVHCEARGVEFDASGLPEPITNLLSLANAVPERVIEDEPRHSLLARVGLAGIGAWENARSTLGFVGEVGQGLVRLVTGRSRMQWRAFWVVVQQNSSGALVIVTIIALLIGVIIAFLGAVVLRRFGAGYYVSYLVGYGMLREMGALMTGIIIAGRTGAGFAAEIGSMKITEELDAYATLGIPAVDYLVLPRMLGLFVMMPLLVIYADFIGIMGGMLVAVALIDLTPTQFFGGLLTAVTLSDAMLGIFKATIFGLLVGFSGCMHGLRTGSDASAVGRSATSAVVLGITLIILANAVVDWLAALWQV